jgi:chorismate mutase
MFFLGGHMAKREEKFYLIRSDILPESIAKTIEAKKLLESGEAETVNEAVERVGISRSAFYKYKDGIFPFNAMMSEKIMTITFTLEHRSGILSKVLQYVAEQGGNILTINQTIPLQGIANVSMSIDMAHLRISSTEFLDGLQALNGVRKAMIVGRG